MKIFKHLQSTKNGCKYVIMVTSFLEYDTHESKKKIFTYTITMRINIHETNKGN